MIVSHTHKFIFLRTEKTAGTSLSCALGTMIAEGDMRANMSRPRWAKFSPIHHGALKRNLPQLFGLHVHASAAQIKSVIGAKTFNSYFKFAVERNPWDRQTSLYFQRFAKRPRSKEPDFSRDILSPVFRATEYVRLNNWANYTIGDDIVADLVIPYDQLEDGLETLRQETGLPQTIELPRMRSGFRNDNGGYRQHYNDKSRALIERWYAREINAFGFEF